MPFLTSGNTNEKCLQSGLYFCHLHPRWQVHMTRGGKFPKCDHGEEGKGHDTKWVLVPPVENS